MKKKTSNDIRMFEVLRRTCRMHEADWVTNGRFVQTFNTFEEKLEIVKSLAEELAEADEGSTDRTTRLRKEISVVLREYLAALNSYALQTENEVLAAQSRMTFSQLHSLKQLEFIAKVEKRLELLNANLVAMEELGITLADIEELEAKLSLYILLLPEKRMNVVKHKSMNHALLEQVKSIKSLLSKKLDPIAKLFREDHPKFYNNYRFARVVINLTRHNPQNTINPDADSHKPERDDGSVSDGSSE